MEKNVNQLIIDMIGPMNSWKFAKNYGIHGMLMR